MKFNFFKKIWGRREEQEDKADIKDKIKEEKVKEVEIKKGINFEISPLITEKSLKLAKENKYVFLVDSKINKTQIRKAIEKMFKVKVEDVNTTNYKKRERGVTKIKSKRPKFKKAIVKLTEGQKIPLFE